MQWYLVLRVCSRQGVWLKSNQEVAMILKLVIGMILDLWLALLSPRDNERERESNACDEVIHSRSLWKVDKQIKRFGIK